MLLAIPKVLAPEVAAQLRGMLRAAEWVSNDRDDGAWCLQSDGEVARAAQAEVTAALMDNAAFLSAALPHTVFPPQFARLGEGEETDARIGWPIPSHHGARVRADLSCNLFLSNPTDYGGGELEIAGPFGKASYKLGAGDLLVYSSASRHRVTPVTRGERLSCFFWLQSLVPDDAARAVLYDLDQSVQALSAERGKSDDEVLRLAAIYHNLVRRWAEA